MLTVILMGVIMISVVMISAVKLNDVMPNVLAPLNLGQDRVYSVLRIFLKISCPVGIMIKL